eukprot:CAMPEP_0178538230 /NCGR_PEP_ID=MMETSP0696-20121128/36998_1 /TAXON_ID=265572 /ORGANISM="Extubocellulus spinifer, Strain CCMP396" /LENGTH=726 /DNA_ID=CAMNT_0020170483 /DNA_START=286 /DNA_END=2466 /DNA_ORIENTATION=+
MPSPKPSGGAGGGGGGRSIPPPINEVLPKSIGPIEVPNRNDVLSGRGGRINAHPGNVQFRELINGMKAVYLSPKTKKLEKAHIANDVVRRIRHMDPPGRFLKEEKDGMWWDIGDEKARKKVGQALREDAPDIRPNLDVVAGGAGAGAAGVAIPTKADEAATARAAAAAAGGSAELTPGDGSTDSAAQHPGTALYPGAPPQGVYRTPSFTSGRGMASPRGGGSGSASKGGGPGRGTGGYGTHPGAPQSSPYGQQHPLSPYGYPPYDPSQHPQGWYGGPGGGGSGVQATKGGADRNASSMTFGGQTFHPTESGATADVSDISELSLNVGASLVSPTGGGGGAAGAAGAAGVAAAGPSPGGGAAVRAGGGEQQFSHRSAWQHNQLLNRAERYAHQAHAAFFPPADGHAHVPSPHHHPGDSPQGGGAPPDGATPPPPYPDQPGGPPQPARTHPGAPLPGAPLPGIHQSVSMGPLGSPHTSRYAQMLHQQQQQSSSSVLKISDKSGSGASPRASDLSMSLGLSSLRGSDPMGKLARSFSLPGIKSGDLMSLGEASFHALLEDEELAHYDAELRKTNPTLGYTGVTMDTGAGAAAAAAGAVSTSRDGAGVPPVRTSGGSGGSDKPPRQSSSSKSNVSGLSAKSNAEASQRSNLSMAEVSVAGSVRSSASSWMRNFKGHDVGEDPWMPMAMEGTDQFSTHSITNSVLSEMSTDLMALDLADPGTSVAAVPRPR